LRALTEQLEPRLRMVWLTDSKFEKRAYNLLRKAYIKARYSCEYVISADQLGWLAQRAAILQTLALLWQKCNFWDSLQGKCVIHRKPALIEAGDGRGLAAGS